MAELDKASPEQPAVQHGSKDGPRLDRHETKESSASRANPAVKASQRAQQAASELDMPGSERSEPRVPRRVHRLPVLHQGEPR